MSATPPGTLPSCTTSATDGATSRRCCITRLCAKEAGDERARARPPALSCATVFISATSAAASTFALLACKLATGAVVATAEGASSAVQRLGHATAGCSSDAAVANRIAAMRPDGARGTSRNAWRVCQLAADTGAALHAMRYRVVRRGAEGTCRDAGTDDIPVRCRRGLVPSSCCASSISRDRTSAVEPASTAALTIATRTPTIMLASAGSSACAATLIPHPCSTSPDAGLGTRAAAIAFPLLPCDTEAEAPPPCRSDTKKAEKTAGP